MGPTDWRLWTAAHFIATFAHFAHNAWRLDAYPGLPADWTPAGVLASWLVVAVPGALGWMLTARHGGRAGWGSLLLFGALGFAGLLHFLFAPVTDHSPTMLAAIVAEALTGAAVIVAVVPHLRRRKR